MSTVIVALNYKERDLWAVELYINSADPDPNNRSETMLEKDIEVAKGSKQKAKQFNSLRNPRKHHICCCSFVHGFGF